MSDFTPQQVEEFLQEFFDVVGTRQYIGARYVPLFGRRGETSIEWDDTAPYEPLTIVLYQGNSYTSRTYVPAGVEITNQTYWANTGNYNAQVETYRQEVLGFDARIDALEDALPIASFGSLNTVKDYVDGNFLHSYDNIESMKADNNLSVGTLAYVANQRNNDGGAAVYEIVSSPDGISGFTVHSLDNELYAKLLSIDECGYIDLRWCGGVPDYSEDNPTYTDNAPAFENAYQYIATHQTIPIFIVGRYGIRTSVDCGYALKMFGTFSPIMVNSEESENVKPTSEIHVYQNTTAFLLTGNDSSRTVSYINLDNIKFSGDGASNDVILINATTFGYPSRPNWIRGCEGRGFTRLLQSVATSDMLSAGTNFYDFTISECNFVNNAYVVYVDVALDSQQGIGSLHVLNSVCEGGGGQFYLKNSMGNVVFDGVLLEGNNGTMELTGVIPCSYEIKNCYFEAQTLTINVSSALYNTILLQGNFYNITANITYNLRTITVINKDSKRSNVILNAATFLDIASALTANIPEITTNVKLCSIENFIPPVAYGIEIPADASIFNGGTEVHSKLGIMTRHNDTYVFGGSATGSIRLQPNQYAAVCFRTFTKGSFGMYDTSGAAVSPTQMTFDANKTYVLVFKNNKAEEVRVTQWFSGTISKAYMTYIPIGQENNYDLNDFLRLVA